MSVDEKIAEKVRIIDELTAGHDTINITDISEVGDDNTPIDREKLDRLAHALQPSMIRYSREFEKRY